MIKKIFRFWRRLLLISLIFWGLLIVLLVSIWVAGPHLFTLDNYKNVLFVSSEMSSQEGKIYLAYFFPSTQEISIVTVKSDSVSVLGGYGEYELKKVMPLLTLERKKTAYKLATMSWSTQTLIDSIIDTKTSVVIEDKKQLLQQLWQASLSHLTTPREFIQLAELFFFTRSVPVEQITFNKTITSVGELDVLNNVILYEDCSVAVVNTTEKNGLALKMSNIIEKNGAVVIRVTDQNSPYQLSTFSFSSAHGSCQSLSERLRVLFPGKVIEQNLDKLQREYRADLIIFIGKDLANLI